MKATLLKTVRHASKYGGWFYYLFFKGEDGKSYRSCVDEKCHNFNRWRSLIGEQEILLDGLSLKRGKDGPIIDADSFSVRVNPPLAA